MYKNSCLVIPMEKITVCGNNSVPFIDIEGNPNSLDPSK